jgi:hypothetical protein
MIERSHQTHRFLSIGAIAVGFAVAVFSFGIVRAELVRLDSKVRYSCSSGTACVEGSSTGRGTWGLYGAGTKDDGVRGVTSTSSGGNGVSGLATGTSTTANGVYGEAKNGNGVYGASAAGVGVEGVGSSTVGVEGVTHLASGTALSAYADNDFAYLLYAYDAVSNTSCAIDGFADLSCTGTISGAAPMQVQHTNSRNRHVLAYAAESATPTIEDLGAARLRDGTANVEIPPDFASAIDRNNAYYVFLTPMGDTRGLYVNLQSPAGFQVRENMHGRSNVEFEYRIVAMPIGAKNERLPAAPPVKALRIVKGDSHMPHLTP